MNEPLPDPADVEPTDAKARAALPAYRITRIGEAEGAAFDEAWGALQREFGPRGELERTEVVQGWLSGKLRPDGDLSWQYHLLAAHDQHGALAGARDCHTSVEPRAGVAVVYLAHTLVLPAHRRRGLAALLRTAPLTLGRRALAAAGVDAARAELLLAGEMEPFDPADDGTRVRLVSYGRAGFQVIPPAVLPYCQPDFCDRSATTEPARPLPLLPVVRRVGHENEPHLPRALCGALLRHLYAIFGTHCRRDDLSPVVDHALAALGRAPAEVPLLPLPTSMHDEARLVPLDRAHVLAHHLPSVRASSTP